MRVIEDGPVHCHKCGRVLTAVVVTWREQTYGFYCAWAEGWRPEGWRPVDGVTVTVDEGECE